MPISPFDSLVFTNRFVGDLPEDPIPDNFVRRVQGAAYSRVTPTPVSAPRLISFIPEMVKALGFPNEAPSHPDFLRVFSGNATHPNMAPHASCYGGHQFGHWAEQLGDGRAINLGEVLCPEGQHLTLQLKGAGRTPYSRSADGRAVLRSSLREYLCSEAVHHLGIPTTRSLCLILTGDSVIRDMFYDGHAKAEPGAIACRVAPSFTRFGHFELPCARGDLDLLKQLVDFSLRVEFDGRFTSEAEGYCQWFEEVAQRTARLMVDWQRVGFVHGVMNTDNLSILGLTIDYGPYGWLEGYDPSWTPNTTDAGGRRYAYGQQPRIARWNLIRLANAIYPLIGKAQPLEDAIERYDQTFHELWFESMRKKLGLGPAMGSSRESLIERLWQALLLRETDFTLFFRGLSFWEPPGPESPIDQIPDFFRTAWYDDTPLSQAEERQVLAWLNDYAQEIHQETPVAGDRQRLMQSVNPRFVFRNYLAQEVIDEIEGGSTHKLERLLNTLRRPYDEQPENNDFAQKRPEWARHRAGCSMLSCSS